MSRRLTLGRRVLPAAALLLLLAPAAFAGGVNLSWDDCGAFGVAQKNFACNTNSGTDVLVISVVPNFAMAALNGHEATVTISTALATLPAWWQRQTSGCRPGAPPASATFPTTNCRDVWSGQAAAGQVYDYPVAGYGPNLARIRTISALPVGLEESVDAVQELYMCRLLMSHVRTVGIGACAGCTESACIVLQSVKLNGPGGSPTQTISNPLLRQHVLWQGSVGGCPGATPTRNRTWGSVKTMYR